MKKRYLIIRFPEEAKKGFDIKKNLIEERIKKLTGKKKSIPLTEILRFFANKKYTVYDNELIRRFYKKRKKGNSEGVKLI